jgi:GTP-binding protein
LANRLLGEKRNIVSNIAGTTRDAVDTPFTRDGRNYVVIDTAGLVKRGMIFEAVDKYAALRALSAIERSEVCFCSSMARRAFWNKTSTWLATRWKKRKPSSSSSISGILAKEKKFDKQHFIDDIHNQFKFLDYAPILFISAETGEGVDKILPAITEAYDGFNRRIPTNVLNKVIMDAQDMNPTPDFNHGRLKILFANQVSIKPPTFVLFCNDPKTAHFSYTRYLENCLRNSLTSPEPRFRSSIGNGNKVHLGF